MWTVTGGDKIVRKRLHSLLYQSPDLAFQRSWKVSNHFTNTTLCRSPTTLKKMLEAQRQDFISHYNFLRVEAEL